MRAVIATWITNPLACIGVVLAIDPVTKEYKAYIGRCAGENKYLDCETIIDWGTKIDPGVAEKLILSHGLDVINVTMYKDYLNKPIKESDQL